MNQLLASVSRGETIWCVGIYDALSAKIAEVAGFGAVMTGGLSVTASLLGLPDLELLSLGENLDVVRRVVGAVSVPVVADIDTGYGNTINVARAVREFRAAGAQAVIIEDQVSPKRCAACVDETTLIPVEDAVAKICAAVEAARGEIAIIARTDAFEPTEAMARAAAYAQAGAQLIQPVSKTFSRYDDLVELRQHCGRPLSLQILGWLERIDRQSIEDIAGLATYSLVPVMTVTAALLDNLTALGAGANCSELPRARTDLPAFKDLIGFDQLIEAHRKYDLASAARPGSAT